MLRARNVPETVALIALGGIALAVVVLGVEMILNTVVKPN